MINLYAPILTCAKPNTVPIPSDTSEVCSLNCWEMSVRANILNDSSGHFISLYIGIQFNSYWESCRSAKLVHVYTETCSNRDRKHNQILQNLVAIDKYRNLQLVPPNSSCMSPWIPFCKWKIINKQYYWNALYQTYIALWEITA